MRLKFLLPAAALVAVTRIDPASAVSGWDYNDKGAYGPKSWGGVCQTGTAQSPIDFADELAEYKAFDRFTMNNYGADPWMVRVVNNGHSFTAMWTAAPGKEATVMGGGLGGKYAFAQLHFHWGGASDRGSEHTVGGKGYPLEMHLVHYNKK